MTINPIILFLTRALVGLSIGIIILMFIVRMMRASYPRREELKYCPHCGARASPSDDRCKKCLKTLPRRHYFFK
jgi:hypothetical protein